MEITGTIVEIFAEQVVSDKFKKREFVLKTVENNFEQEIIFQTVQDKTTILNFVKAGEEVKVLFNLGGRSWTNKEGVKNWFNSVTAWRIEKAGGAAATAPAQSVDPTEDLPF